MLYYTSCRNDQIIIEKLQELADKYPTRGFDNYYGKIRLEGLKWNRKAVLRVYRYLNLKMRRKRRRRIPKRIKEALVVPHTLNQTWSVDFMSDSLVNGRRFRILNFIDDCNREALINEAYYSIPAEKLVERLKDLIRERGLPKTIRTDNGPEFISKSFRTFCEQNKITLKFIQPGKPAQNAYIERFNRTFREDVLDAYLFEDLLEVNALAFNWQINYNQNHPHKALKGMSPWIYKNQIMKIINN